MKLSVIVPVYNSKKYLKQCLDSILHQSFRDIEILLIEDGSTDGSAEICDAYKNIDGRVRVVHQKNKGCAAARQCGVQNSTGTYIGFVDSDDWIAEDMYETLMYEAQKNRCDIVSMGYTEVHGAEESRNADATLFGLYEKGRNMDTLLECMMYDGKANKRGVNPALCSKVFRREVLTEAFAEMDDRITIGEDAAIFYPCCLRVGRIFVMKEYKYYYRLHDASMCRSMDIHTAFAINLFYQYMEKCLDGYDKKYALQKQLKKYVWTFVGLWLWQTWKLKVRTAYLFPYAAVEGGSRIILYGAGEVGFFYYRQIQENQYCRIAAWADKKGNGKDGIVGPEALHDLEFDKIVIAVKEEKTADEIQCELTGLGIDREKMLWISPQELPLNLF